jgi:hypothetical protein
MVKPDIRLVSVYVDLQKLDVLVGKEHEDNKYSMHPGRFVHETFEFFKGFNGGVLVLSFLSFPCQHR